MKTFIKQIVFYLAIFSFFVANFSYADTADELRSKISDTLENKRKIELEISEVENQLKDVGKQATTLASAIKSLDATINKNKLDIKLTQNKIDSAELEIKRLSIEIDKNVITIDKDTVVIASLINEVNKNEVKSTIENLLSYKSFSELFNDLNNYYKLQNQIKQKITDTKETKQNLEDNKKITEDKRKELLKLKLNLEDQRKILDISKKEKNKLLADTKNTEANYQKVLAQKKALAAAFDKELLQFESDLKFAIDPSKFPSSGKGILSWPLDVVRITQKFGNTDFAKSGAYNGQGHNGVDFGTPVGTPIKAALSGRVLGVGDTDIVCNGASYGRWVFIEHANGLSTIYAHLSLIKVKQGEIVTTGNIIGYSGNTGYSIGPHLHFGVYASQGVKVMSLKSRVCSGSYIIPVADLRAYLDPLLYL